MKVCVGVILLFQAETLLLKCRLLTNVTSGVGPDKRSWISSQWERKRNL